MRKDYTPKAAGQAGPTFKLYDAEFHCASMVSGDVIIGFTNLMVASKDDDGENTVEVVGEFGAVLAALDRLFEAAINDPAEFATWQELRQSNTKVIPISTLVAIGTDLADFYAEDLAGDERPTTPSSGGGSGKRSRRGGSKAGASPEASGPQTYTRSEPATTSR